MIKLFVASLLAFQLSGAATFAWSQRLGQDMLITEETALVGLARDYIVPPGETLMELARRARIGFDNLQRANPEVDPWNPPTGERLNLPSATLLPDDLPAGITINLAELRLYLVRAEGTNRRVQIFPIGIGRAGWETPLGDFEVSVVIDNPAWTPPASLRTERPGLPGTVLPGPDNPLGSHWIGLTAQGVGIHGTNQPFGVGRRISHGCIRLYPRDIIELARQVGPGTRVRIVDQPVKSKVRNETLFLEVHRTPENLDPALIPTGNWHQGTIDRVLREARGLPVAIPAQE